MKKVLILGLGMLLCACSASQTLESEGTYTSSKGEITTAKVTFEGDKIKKIELDETTGGTSKKSLGDSYDMTQASGIGKNWKDQVAYLEDYIEKNGMDAITVNEEGKAENEDLKSGCTISIDAYLKAIQNAKDKQTKQ